MLLCLRLLELDTTSTPEPIAAHTVINADQTHLHSFCLVLNNCKLIVKLASGDLHICSYVIQVT